MSQSDKSGEEKTEIEEKSAISSTIQIVESEIDENEEKLIKQVNQEEQESNLPSQVPTLLPIPKNTWKEAPKYLPKKADNDIEEFDTDEEEEEEEDPNKAISAPSSYTENLKYEGGEYVYLDPQSGQKLAWNSTENKWCKQLFFNRDT